VAVRQVNPLQVYNLKFKRNVNYIFTTPIFKDARATWNSGTV